MNAKTKTPPPRRGGKNRTPAPMPEGQSRIIVHAMPGQPPQISMPNAATARFVEAHWQDEAATTMIDALVELEDLAIARARAEKAMSEAAMKPEGPARDAEIWRYGTLIMVLAKRVDALEERACSAWPPVSHVEAFGGRAGA
jgi:hypothetical protein